MKKIEMKLTLGDTRRIRIRFWRSFVARVTAAGCKGGDRARNARKPPHLSSSNAMGRTLCLASTDNIRQSINYMIHSPIRGLIRETKGHILSISFWFVINYKTADQVLQMFQYRNFFSFELFNLYYNQPM